jgi:hypothetical protein
MTQGQKPVCYVRLVGVLGQYDCGLQQIGERPGVNFIAELAVPKSGRCRLANSSGGFRYARI